jgi:hypothetical protein
MCFSASLTWRWVTVCYSVVVLDVICAIDVSLVTGLKMSTTHGLTKMTKGMV